MTAEPTVGQGQQFLRAYACGDALTMACLFDRFDAHDLLVSVAEAATTAATGPGGMDESDGCWFWPN